MQLGVFKYENIENRIESKETKTDFASSIHSWTLVKFVSECSGQ